MIRNILFKKSVVVFLILITLTNVFMPTIALALTSGPTAPEATSFEPVDTTDMVNLATGDFVYNIPLLEVPGPSGGYPLSLSYHGGIQPGEDASWVGLGWTLNPGAISRNVNGFADDHNNVQNSNRIFWEGGVTKTYSVGVSVGINGLATVNAGLAYSQDTYKGEGLGGSLGASIGLGKDSPLGIRASVGVSPYGGANASAGLNIGVGKAEGGAYPLSTQIGVSTNFKSIQANAGYGTPMMGASISTNGHGSSSSAHIGGGTLGINNSKIGKITTNAQEFGLDFPIAPAVTVSLGYNYMRYWMDETEKVATYGTLYSPTSTGIVNDFDLKAFDSYSLQDPSANSADYVDPNFSLGASFPNYDDYNVNAQGLGGSIRPYSFKNLIFRQNKKKDNQYEIKQYPYDANNYQNEKLEFRFLGDFSNKYISSNEQWSSGTGPLSASYGSSLTGESGSDGVNGNRLAGSKHVDWYTNQSIIDNLSAGLIGKISTTGFDRSTAPQSQIGAFKIMNESGVTYHFALPAYAYDEYQYSENIKQTDGKTYNEFKKPEKYAYTWFLTGITGPDYVDRGGVGNGPNGQLDASDWGYWVEFQYGKWTENYAWRNPSEGYHDDLDNNFKNYASGKKEVYYLDAIKTKTHTALFVKDIRFDAKSASVAYNLQKKSDFGFFSSDYNETYKKKVYDPQDPCEFIPRSYTETTSTYTHKTYPVSMLKLSKIYLLENESLNTKILLENSLSSTESIKSLSNVLDFTITGNKHESVVRGTWPCESIIPQNPQEACECTHAENRSTPQVTDSPINLKLHYGSNVLDVSDFSPALLEDIDSNSLRAMNFGTDYILAPETANSFDHTNLYSNPPGAYSTNTLPKLTLTSLSFLGKAGADLTPPIQFGYETKDLLHGSGNITSNNGNGVFNFRQTSSGLSGGDIIKFAFNNKTCYALVQTATGADHLLKIVGKFPAGLGLIDWRRTKNPPYNGDYVDMWGLYKSDYVGGASNNLSRPTTPISAKAVDAWSLRRITSSTGSDILIDFEADTYSKSVLQNSGTLIVDGISFVSSLPPIDHPPFSPQSKFLLTVRNEGLDLRNVYAINQAITCALVYPDNSSGSTKPNTVSSAVVSAITESTIEVVMSVDNTFFYGGNVYYAANVDKVGGGFRVKSISVDGGWSNKKNTTKYSYNLNGRSSGVTSFEPDVNDKIDLISENDEAESFLKRVMNSNLSQILSSAREVPAPGVMYQAVTIRESVEDVNGEIELPSYSTYTFEVLNKNMIGFVQSEQNATTTSTFGGITYTKVRKKDISLNDFTQWLGKLKSITLYDANGNKLSETVNRYLHDDLGSLDLKSLDQVVTEYKTSHLKYLQQGTVQESFWDARFVKSSATSNYELFGSISKRHVYPAILTSQSNINYKTEIRSESENLAFDFYSGEVTKTLSDDGYGNSYLVETTPAYRKYGAMGLAMGGGKNMLTQEAAQYVYNVDPANVATKKGLVSASTQTWSDQSTVLGIGSQSGIWREHGRFNFIGDDNLALLPDGLYVPSNVTEFNAWTQQSSIPVGWQKNGAITLYDNYSHGLEASDINGNFAATKMSLDQIKVFATAVNSTYEEFAFTGLEESPGTDGLLGGGVIFKGEAYTEIAHTGKNAAVANPTVTSKKKGLLYSFAANARTYHVAVWSNQPDANLKYKINGGGEQTAVVVSRTNKAGAWYLLEANIPISVASPLEVWCEANSTVTYFDDFRVHPLDASMVSYVYNEWGELSFVLNGNNLFTEYQYDGMGKLKATFKETFKEGRTKTSETTYHYANH
jgi:hypothetical protein